jgi:hypothetical protein
VLPLPANYYAPSVQLLLEQQRWEKLLLAAMSEHAQDLEQRKQVCMPFCGDLCCCMCMCLWLWASVSCCITERD